MITILQILNKKGFVHETFKNSAGLEFVHNFSDEGTTLVLDSEVTDETLTVNWYKAARASGKTLVAQVNDCS